LVAVCVCDIPARVSASPAALERPVTAAGAAMVSGSTIALSRIAGQRVRPGYGEIVRVGQIVAVSGSVARRPAHARVQLQGRTISSAWRALVGSALRGVGFRLRWHVRTRGVFQLRAMLLAGRHLIATSAVAPVLVGPAIVPCRPAPAPAALPAGDGWVAGGVYFRGGPAPGIDECQSRPSTLTATSASGQAAARQQLAGGSGYALVLPAGTYELRDGVCTGQATVIAGRRTIADTNCDFP
jgi:hypothetical protein